MKKTNIFLVGILVCIAYFFYFSEYIDKANKRYEEEQGKRLFQIQPNNVTGISGTLEGTRFDMTKRDGVWRLVLPVLDDVNSKTVQEILQIISEMKFESHFVPDDGDYSIFELQNPNYVWHLKDDTGKEHTLKIGDVNIMGSKGYARIGEEAKVYLISLSDRNSLIKRPNDFRKKSIYQENIENLSKVEIKRGEETIVFVKEDEKWVIGDDGFPVNNELIRKIKDGLASLEIQSFVAEDLDNRETYLANSQQVTFFTGEKKLKLTIEIAPEKADRYATIEGKERIVTINGNYSGNFEHKADDFRERKLFTLPAYQVTSLVLKREDKKLELKEQENNWFLNKNIKANSAKVHDLVQSFIALEIANFSTTISAGDLQKVVSITLVDREGKRENAVIYESLFQAEKFFVATANGNDFYPLDGGKPKDFLTTASDLENRKIFSFDAQEIDSILLRHSGQKELTFQREGNLWKGKNGENKEIIDFLWTLQDISWLQKNIEIPTKITTKSELELSGTGETLKFQLFSEGFCAVNGNKYEISTKDIGKITDFLDKLY